MPNSPRTNWYISALHQYKNDGKNDKVYIIFIEYHPGSASPYHVKAAADRRLTKTGQYRTYPKGVFASLGDAETVMEDIFQEKKREGYLDIESDHYANQDIPQHMNLKDGLMNSGSFDTSHILGYAIDTDGNVLRGFVAPVAIPSPPSAPPANKHASGRVKRTVD